MKYFHLLLFLAVLLSGCFGNSAQPLLKKSPYDADFKHSAKKLSGKTQKTKHLKKMESAYQSAQKADLVAVDSLLNSDKPDRWLYVNAFHRRIQDRQQKVLALLPLEGNDGYKPDFLFITNIAEREAASRQAAANYLYEQAEILLAKETRADAREAYATLLDLHENYYPVWENSAVLLDSAAQLGVEHVLIEGVCQPSGLFDSKWQKFYRNPSARPAFDILINTASLNVLVSPDQETRNSYTETRDVVVRYEEKKDSNGVVIERSPIYETVSVTVTETIIEKYADASVLVDVIDGINGDLIYATTISGSSIFSESHIKIEGDQRALSSNVTASLFSIFTPTYWAMESKVLEVLNYDFNNFVRGQLWTDK